MGKPCYKPSPSKERKKSNRPLSKKENELVKQELEVLKNLILNKLKNKNNIDKTADILKEISKNKK